MNVAAIGTWIVCGLSPLVLIARAEFTGWPAAAFVAAFVLFGGALLAILFQRPAAKRHAAMNAMLVAVQSLSALAMLALSIRYTQGSGATSAALVIVAAELPYLMPPAVSWTWIASQTVCMAGALHAANRVGWIDTLTFAAAIGGFQLFAASSSVLARRQAEGRVQLARVNDELRATRARLEESSRAEERVRISRDLHDALGHHLTALSLQLDVASRLVDGKPAEHVRQAHAITRLLLGDVRDVVSRLRDGGPVDLVRAVRALTVPALEVSLHLDLPVQLAIDDRDRASAVVRCVQEVITNTARHARARNLWVRLEPRGNGVAIHAHDDGQGAQTVTPGHGLTGMRERFAEHGGSVEFAATPGAGFDVRAFMPGTGAA